MPPRNLLVIGLTIVVSLACYSVASKNRYANLFAEAMEVIDQQSLREVPREKLFVSAMEGMMEDLDEHSMYISGEMFQVFDEDIRQEFGGVGMYVETDPQTKQLFVLAPMPGTPAFEAGLRAGDRIEKIDGEETAGKSRREAVKNLRGPIGKTVELDIERGDEHFTVNLNRAVIPVASAHGDYRNPDGTWRFVLKENARIGYIRLIQFGEKSTDEMRNALNQSKGKIDGLIIDLRNNSGGLLDVAIDICDMFLPTDLPIVRTRGRDKQLVRGGEYFSTASLDLNPGIPICILVNRNSASASEIVAGCLQDHGRAILIGEQSWGKGTVQNVIPIQRGESALKLTTASYWRPSGKNIDRYDDVSKETKIWGVQPNEGFAIELTEDEVFANIRNRNIRDLQGLVTERESELISNMRNFETPADSDTPDQQETPVADDGPEGESRSPHVDLPLQRAIEYFELQFSKNQIAA